MSLSLSVFVFNLLEVLKEVYCQFAQLMTGKKPKPSFDIEEAERNRVASFLQKTIKKLRMKKPSIQKARTIKFDANCYDSFEHCGRQYIKVMSLERGKRIVIPLKGKAKLQGNRKLSCWVKGKIQDRVEFKALAKGFRHEPVNPAYGSQICLHCDFVDKKNRNQDKFKRLYCGYEDIADRVAALNYARRYEDKKIGLYMPYNQVKTILLERFHRRLETGKPVTVPGKTLETVTWVDPPPKSRNQSREKTSFL